MPATTCASGPAPSPSRGSSTTPRARQKQKAFTGDWFRVGEVDGALRTSVPGVWAIGDLVPGPALAHKASDEGVKSFGQTLVQDHTEAYEELTAVASKTGESIPKGIDIRRDRAIEGLAREKRASFDRSFVRHEVQHHQRTIAEFKREAEKGQNAEVKAYAQKMIPTLEEHLHKAESLEKSEQRTSTASASRRSR